MHADLAARRSRVAASWIVALVTTVVAASAHTLAGGAAPHALALLVGVGASGFLGMTALSALRAGRLSRLGLAAVVALDQTVFHLVFSLLGPAGGAAVATGADAPAGHPAHGAIEAAAVAIAPAGIPVEAAAPLAGATALMGLHHAVAALTSYALLRRGSEAVAAALHALGLALARLLEPVVAAAAPVVGRAPLGGAGRRLLPAVVVLGGSGRRGPPAVALAR
ncbi:hypothetical protein ASG83_09145 [Yonghaparkia sp. Soil809]|nr:hypothetical protein ASC54_09315 [Yonghaparkia sp. Root332]KRF30989.1 hypothetical protein ASG83_09145 [Yonghaparkia sp. Soil809]